jgi:hypothetical protein
MHNACHGGNPPPRQNGVARTCSTIPEAVKKWLTTT